MKKRFLQLTVWISVTLATAFVIAAVLSLFSSCGVAHNSARYRVAFIAFPLYLLADELHGPAAAVAVHPHGAHRPAVWEYPLGTLLPQLFDLRRALLPHLRILHYLGVTSFQISVPFWLLSALSGLPAFVIWSRQARGDQLGLCTSCGYDLRATPHRCPECGAVPTEETSPSGPPRGVIKP